jgi:hypothetical protein
MQIEQSGLETKMKLNESVVDKRRKLLWLVLPVPRGLLL